MIVSSSSMVLPLSSIPLSLPITHAQPIVQVAISCRSKDPRGGSCVGQVACWDSRLASSTTTAAEKFSIGTAAGQWQYAHANTTAHDALRAGTVNPCSLQSDPRFGNVIRCNAKDPMLVGTTAARSGATLRCWAEGLILLLPDGEEWENYEISFNFKTPAVVDGRIGLVARWNETTRAHYAWFWGGNSTTGGLEPGPWDLSFGPRQCTGVYARRSSTAYDGLSCARPRADIVGSLDTNLCVEAGKDDVLLTHDAETSIADPALTSVEGMLPNTWHYARFSVLTTKGSLSTQRNVQFVGKIFPEGSALSAFIPAIDVNRNVTGMNARGSAGLMVWNMAVDFTDIVVRHLKVEDGYQLDAEDKGCGDGVCDADSFEDCVNCPADCDVPCGCGDFFCEGDTEVLACPHDCGVDQANLPLKEEFQFKWLPDLGCPIKNIFGKIVGGPLKPSDSNGYARVAAYWSFDDPFQPLFDNSDHGMHMKRPEGLSVQAIYNSSGTATHPTGSLALPGGYVTTTASKPLTLDDPRTAYGRLPIEHCSFAIMFWARLDSAADAGPVVTWGDARAGRENFRLSVDIEPGTFATVVRLGHRVVRFSGIKWNAPLSTWHHVAVAYQQSGTNEVRLYVDGVRRGVSTTCSFQGAGLNTYAHITYGTFKVGAFTGAVDELKIFATSVEDAQVVGDYNSLAFRKIVEPLSPATTSAAGGVLGPPPTHAWLPREPQPTPATPVPTPPRKAASICSKISSCGECNIRSESCQWCNRCLLGSCDRFCYPKNSECPNGVPVSPFCDEEKQEAFAQGTPCGTDGVTNTILVADACGTCGGSVTKLEECPVRSAASFTCTLSSWLLVIALTMVSVVRL